MIAAVATTDSAELVRFEIPGKPRNWSNMRGHWSRRYSLQRDWKERSVLFAQQARIQAGLPMPERDPSFRRRLEIILHSARLYDGDNAYAAVKPIVDGLEGILIVSDRQDWCEISVRQEPVQGYKNQRVEVIVRSVLPPPPP